MKRRAKKLGMRGLFILGLGSKSIACYFSMRMLKPYLALFYVGNFL